MERLCGRLAGKWAASGVRCTLLLFLKKKGGVRIECSADVFVVIGDYVMLSV